MKENQLNSYNNLEEDSIDIIALLKTLWIGKKLIVKTTILFFVVGCVVALLSPVVYTSETTFVPQVSDDQMSSSKAGLGSLASLAGINLDQMSSTSDSYFNYFKGDPVGQNIYLLPDSNFEGGLGVFYSSSSSSFIVKITKPA